MEASFAEFIASRRQPDGSLRNFDDAFIHDAQSVTTPAVAPAATLRAALAPPARPVAEAGLRASQRKRRKLVLVDPTTFERVSGEAQGSKAIAVSRGKWLGTYKFPVLKGTSTRVNACDYPAEAIEYITQGTRAKRQPKLVLVGTTTEVDPSSPNFDASQVETISIQTLQRRRAKANKAGAQGADS